MPIAIDRNKALNKLNFLNLRKLTLTDEVKHLMFLLKLLTQCVLVNSKWRFYSEIHTSPTRNKLSPKARSDAHPSGSGKMHFPLDSPHRQKKIQDFMQRKTFYCIIFMSYKAYGMFMINTQYVNCRHQRRF